MIRLDIKIIASLSLLFLTSCTIYKQEFECPPPQGVPCTSETDLESMVVETDCGPDIFLPVNRDDCSCHKNMSPAERVCTALGRKVWICHQLTEDGCRIQGHYIYQNEDQRYPVVSCNPILSTNLEGY